MYLVVSRGCLGAPYFLRTIVASGRRAQFYRHPHYRGNNTGAYTSQSFGKVETIKLTEVRI